MKDTVTIVNDLDNEWVALIMHARELGMTIEEIRDFLNQPSGDTLVSDKCN